MITEDSISDQPEKKPVSDKSSENNAENSPTKDAVADEISVKNSQPAEDTVSVESDNVLTEVPIEEQAAEETQKEPTDSEPINIEMNTFLDNQPVVEYLAKPSETEAEANISESLAAQNDETTPFEKDTAAHDEEPKLVHPEDENSKENIEQLNLSEVLAEMKALINNEDVGANFRTFNQYKERANHLIHEETELEKKEFAEGGNAAEEFNFHHPQQQALSAILNQFREKNDEYTKKQEANHSKNLEERQQIIERLKSLYTNTEAGTNLFKAIREVKDAWKNAGQVAKSEFKILNNNYFHHLNQFYQMLDLNKEYMEQEFAHNLERRLHIIERAQQLQAEPAVQKALNELQYLHKLWKEEAEPVAEEFREKTWELFKDISNKIHDRKSELSSQIEGEQAENLEKKNKIIGEIKKLSTPEKEPNHSYWQNSIKKIEDLRSEFLKIGSVPRKISNQNWNEFKLHLKNFNTAKNEFYKGLKSSQQSNLDKKLQLIQTAKDSSLSEDWETTVPLFKKLQEEWKTVGHVPRSMTNKVWDEFREACNTFFNNYREKNNAVNDNWKENYKQKKQLLEELKEVTDQDGSVEKIESVKTRWNNIGKVPREKLAINTEFNKTLREKMKLNKIHDYDLKEEGLSENQLTDKARKIKNQIADLEAEIVKMETNLGFFSNPTRENPLLKETYVKIDDKKAQLESMKQSLHSILAGENQ